MRTGGNALRAPEDYPMNAKETVSVTVPPNKYGGDQILVSAPSGKCVSTVIPAGMRFGDKFQVDVPNDPFDHGTENQVHHSMNQNHQPPAQAVTPIEVPAPSAPMMQNYFSNVPIAAAIPETRQDTGSPSIVNSFNPTPTPAPVVDPNQNLMLVKVPPGCAPGTIIHVQVPGENRMVAAKVPPNVVEFHVAYEPKPKPQRVQTPQVRGQTVPTLRQRNQSLNNFDGSHNGHQTAYSGNGGYNEQNRYQNRNHSHNQNNHSDGGMGILAPILGGATMLGAAGYMIGHHDNSGG